MLLLAIITEVASTSFMKLAVDQSPMLGYSLMAVLISISYFFLSQAVPKNPSCYRLYDVGRRGIATDQSDVLATV